MRNLKTSILNRRVEIHDLRAGGELHFVQQRLKPRLYFEFFSHELLKLTVGDSIVIERTVGAIYSRKDSLQVVVVRSEESDRTCGHGIGRNARSC